MPTDCPECGGTGFALRTEPSGVVSSVRCECEKDRLGERLLQRAGIPRRYRHCTFDAYRTVDPTHAPALEHCRGWVDGFLDLKKGLLLLGPPGTGKTHLAVAIASEVVARYRQSVRFYEQRALLKKLRETFDGDAAASESSVFAPVLECDLLVLDDLGAGRTTHWARDVLHDVISQRYNDERLLVITTNLALDEEEVASKQERPATLRERLGDALLSRVYEMCEILPVRGRDFRAHELKH